MGKLQKKSSAMFSEGSLFRTYFASFLDKLHILKFQDIFELQTLKQTYLYFHNMIPQPTGELFVRNEDVHNYMYNTRLTTNSQVHKWNTALGKKKFFSYGNPSLVPSKCRVAECV